MASILDSLLADGHVDRPNFLNDWDYVQLRRTLEKLVVEGRVRKVPVFNPLHAGHQEWFLDTETGDIYSLTPREERAEPMWEKVDVFDTRDWQQKQRDWQVQLGEVDRGVGYLAPIRTGRKDSAELYFLRDVLQRYIAQGQVEAIKLKENPLEAGTHAEWYKDKTTGEIYGLIYDPKKNEYHWEMAKSPESRSS